MLTVRPRLAALVAMMALAIVAPAAQAGPLAETADCSLRPPMAQVFLPWADPANYVLSPDGGMEGGAAGWTLDGTAAVVSGNESYYIRDASDSKSLSLPAGSSATSAAMCVGLGHPTVRFFTKANGTGLLSRLKVEVMYEDGLTGAVITLPIGVALPSAGWQVTLPMTILMNILSPLTKDGMAPVAFRFTPVGSGSWRIDDFYVDPVRKP
jgi:hypothetical protein